MKSVVWLFPVISEPQYALGHNPIIYWAMRSQFTTGAPDGCIECRLGTEVTTEHALLYELWNYLTPQIVGRPIAGWRLYDRVWPALINRSIINRVAIPPWARHDPSKRWTTLTFYDVFGIFTQGKRLDNHDRDLTLSQILELWLPDEPLLPLVADNVIPEHYGCLALDAMQRVVQLYEAD